MTLNFEISEVNVPRVDTSFGGFRIAHEIARGGMASVYLGYRSGIGGFVQPSAIKVIHPHMASDRGFVEMFIDEARIASCINHPNVCKVLDFGKAGRTFYLAMEYLFGETWGHTLQAMYAQPGQAMLIPEMVAHVLAQACEGLHAAHEAHDHRGRALQIVHRDVSPQNLFVGYDGSVKVLDFGIAQAADRLHSTRNGTIKGRYSYMSPEQMSGYPVDRRSDVWSLGVVLREGLTGKSVFRRSTDAETIHAVVNLPVPEWDMDVDPTLRKIVDTALQHDPEDRFETAREMGTALRRFLRSRVDSLGMAEVSGIMQLLFSSNQQRKRALVQQAARSFAPGRPVSLPPPSANFRAEEQTPTDPDPGEEQERTLERLESTRAEFVPRPSVSAHSSTTRVAPDEEQERTLERLEATKVAPELDNDDTLMEWVDHSQLDLAVGDSKEKATQSEHSVATVAMAAAPSNTNGEPTRVSQSPEPARADAATRAENPREPTREQEIETQDYPRDRREPEPASKPPASHNAGAATLGAETTDDGETVMSMTRPLERALLRSAVLEPSPVATEKVTREPTGKRLSLAKLALIGGLSGCALWLGASAGPFADEPIPQAKRVEAAPESPTANSLAMHGERPNSAPTEGSGRPEEEPEARGVAQAQEVEAPVPAAAEVVEAAAAPAADATGSQLGADRPIVDDTSTVSIVSREVLPKPLRKRALRRPAPAPLALGTVNVSSDDGWADVYEGSRKLGSTPVRLLLLEGTHTLSFRSQGAGPSKSLQVVVRGGQVIKVKAPL
ncbi:MAG: protein kinase [Myxococcales bacterium]